MKKIISYLQLTMVAVISLLFIQGSRVALAAPCPGGGFLGLPTWHKHLEGVETDEIDSITGTSTGNKVCAPQIDGLSDIWKIVAAVLELLLRLASLIAIGLVVYGGVTYITSQGSPDKTKQALKTIINALIGLVISIIAAALVGFIAGRF